MNPHVALAVEALERLLGDNFARAQRAFRNCTAEEMAQEYGQSGETRQQILDGYREHHDRVAAAIAWVKERQ